MVTKSLLIVFALIPIACQGNGPTKPFGEFAARIISKGVPDVPSPNVELATLAAGCFWGVELSFQRIPGVLKTEVGYTQGHKKNPTYEEVCSGTTGHAEAVQVTYNPAVVTYDELLTVFWDRFNPTTLNRQGGDVGTQYRSGIYYHSDEQRQIAEESLRRQQSHYQEPIVTEILPATEWYAAESYHQQYLEKGGQCSLKGDLTPIRCYG